MTRDFFRRLSTPDPRLATVVLLSLLFVACSQSSPPPSSPLRILVLHTADLHGQVDRLPSLAAYLDSERRKAEASGIRVLYVDAGDFFQGTPEGDLTRGRVVVEALDAMRCDALVPGNHDFDLGPGVTEELARAARFPFLAANLRRTGGRGPPPWVKPSLRRPELRLELVGLVTSEMEKLSSRRAREGLEFAPEAEALAAHAWAPGAARILVTHIGIERDRALPLKGIAAILGGHTHVAAVETLANGTILMHPGSHGTSVGRLELELDSATGAVRSAKAAVVALDGIRGDAAIRELIDARTAEIRKAMAERVGRLAAVLPRGGAEFDGVSSPLGNHVADVVLEAAGAEASVILRSSIRSSLFAGPVRRRDLYEATPFPDTIVAVTVTGARLRSALEGALGDDERLLVEVAGIELEYDRSAPSGRRIGRLEVAGAPLEPKRAYRVASLSFMTEPDGLFAGAADLRDTGRTLYDAHADFFRARPKFQPGEFRPRIARTP